MTATMPGAAAAMADRAQTRAAIVGVAGGVAAIRTTVIGGPGITVVVVEVVVAVVVAGTAVVIGAAAIRSAGTVAAAEAGIVSHARGEQGSNDGERGLEKGCGIHEVAFGCYGPHPDEFHSIGCKSGIFVGSVPEPTLKTGRSPRALV